LGQVLGALRSAQFLDFEDTKGAGVLRPFEFDLKVVIADQIARAERFAVLRQNHQSRLVVGWEKNEIFGLRTATRFEPAVTQNTTNCIQAILLGGL
jgi:hypothetical protein